MPDEDFLKEYKADFGTYQAAAKSARLLVALILKEHNVPLYAVQGRAKDVASLRRKLRKKSYKNPRTDITDLVGIRVVCPCTTDVDLAKDVLAPQFRVSKKHSVDKRGALGPTQFGYRSLHLVVKLKADRAKSLEYKALKGQWIEIQIRTILEHAWAELEHEVVYKSGIEFPEAVIRRFASLAGTLEILDREFVDLRDHRSVLLEQLSRDLAAGAADCSKELDAVGLVAILKVARPDGPSFFGRSGDLPPHAEALCTEALLRAGIRTREELQTALSKPDLGRAIDAYAAAHALAGSEVSHFAVVLCLLAVSAPDVVAECFPEYLNDLAALAM